MWELQENHSQSLHKMSFIEFDLVLPSSFCLIIRVSLVLQIFCQTDSIFLSLMFCYPHMFSVSCDWRWLALFFFQDTSTPNQGYSPGMREWSCSFSSIFGFIAIPVLVSSRRKLFINFSKGKNIFVVGCEFPGLYFGSNLIVKMSVINTLYMEYAILTRFIAGLSPDRQAVL